jgi:hypothetical protein
MLPAATECKKKRAIAIFFEKNRAAGVLFFEKKNFLKLSILMMIKN